MCLFVPEVETAQRMESKATDIVRREGVAVGRRLTTIERVATEEPRTEQKASGGRSESRSLQKLKKSMVDGACDGLSVCRTGGWTDVKWRMTPSIPFAKIWPKHFDR